jgi:5-(carboxyamino)imidazole ribonucleotide synthase
VLDESVPDLPQAALEFAAAHEGAVVAKASTGGYDGRGVWMLEAAEIGDFLRAYDGAPLVLEPRLVLERELAVVVARTRVGDTLAWPVVDTIQVDGMCRTVVMPAAVPDHLALQARDTTLRLAELMEVVGVMAVEFFVVDGELLINEVAPRVHNSGHVTIDACVTSQFQQHLRAILGWRLGPAEQLSPAAAMVNVVGGVTATGDVVDPSAEQAAALELVPGAHIHLYGKESRPKRKLGHVTVVGADRSACIAAAERAAAALEGQLL